MRKLKVILLLTFMMLLFIGCNNELDSYETTFKATVLENETTTLLVEPVEGSAELNSADKISVSISDTKLLDANGKEITIDDISPEMEVEIFYDGAIAESYPAQIHNCSKVVVVD